MTPQPSPASGDLPAAKSHLCVDRSLFQFLGKRCARGLSCGGRCEGDGVAELFELFDEAAGAVLGRVALVVPFGSEFAVGDLVADDEVERGEDVVSGCSDRFGVAASA